MTNYGLFSHCHLADTILAIFADAKEFKNKVLLPVYWMHNSKIWKTKVLTIKWLLHCFISQVKLHLTEKSLPFKSLLLMDCAGGHATDLQYDKVQIEFLPPNTFVSADDQGVIRGRPHVGS